MTYTCKLCGREFDGLVASHRLAGHTAHCKRRRRDVERTLLLEMAAIAREVVGERYSSTEPTEISHIRMMLDKYDNWREEVGK
jgi:hypothetical protein